MKTYRNILLSPLLALLLAPAAPAQETEYFLHFVPDNVQGETVDAQFRPKKAMELISFFFGGENQTNIEGSTGGAGGAGKVVFNRFACIAPAGTRAAQDLVREMAKGAHFDEVVLSARRGTVIFTITFKLVVISQVEIEGTRGDEPLMNFVLDWGAMQFKSFKTAPDGTVGDSEAAEALWSRVRNEFSTDVTSP